MVRCSNDLFIGCQHGKAVNLAKLECFISQPAEKQINTVRLAWLLWEQQIMDGNKRELRLSDVPRSVRCEHFPISAFDRLASSDGVRS